MEQIPLAAQKRAVFGRKVKNLRNEGFIPAHVFGHKIKTIHVQVKASEFSKVFEKVGETGIVDLAIDGLASEASAKGAEKKPVLIRNLQVHPVSDEPLHIDFYQVSLTEKVKVNVPVEIVGESPAVAKKIGLLLTPVSEIEIEALPTDIPEKIEIDVAKLENVGDEIKVKDLNIDRAKVEVLTDPELVVAQVGELVTKEMEAVEAEIEAEQVEAQAEAVAEAAPEEGAAAAVEGEEKAEGEGGEPVEEKLTPKEKTTPTEPEQSKAE